MANFFKDNPDLQFSLEHLDLSEAVALREDNYRDAEKYEGAPVNFQDALDN